MAMLRDSTVWSGLRSVRRLIERHPAIIFAIWAGWLSATYWALGQASYVRVHDNGNSWLPAKLALSHYGNLLDCWDRFAACGSDRFADWGNRLFDLGFWVLPGWMAHGAIMWLQRFTAGYFTYRVLRENGRVSLVPATYAALTYSLFSQNALNYSWAGLTLYDGFGSCGLPFYLWLLHRQQPPLATVQYIVAFGGGVLFSLVCHYSMSLFILVALPLWFGFVLPRRELSFWVCLCMFLAGWAVAGMVDIIPAALNASESQRAHWSIDSPFRHDFGYNLAFASRLIWENIVSVLLIAVALVAARVRSKALLGVTGCAVGCVLYVLVYPNLTRIAFNHVGFVRGFQLDRIYLIVPFFLIAGSAFALEELLSLQTFKVAAWRWPCWLATVATVSTLAASVSINWRILNHTSSVNFASFSSLYRQPALAQLKAANSGKEPFRVASVGGGASGLEAGFVWAHGLESADGFMQVYPERFHQYWERVIMPVMSTDRYVSNFFHYFGDCAYLFVPSSGLNASEIDFQKYYRLELLSLANVRYLISERPIHDSRLSLLPSTCRDKQFQWESLPKLEKLVSHIRGTFPGSPLYIYENTQCLPRFFLAQTAEVLPTEKSVLDGLSEASIQQLQSTAYLSRKEVTNIPVSQLTEIVHGTVEVKVYGADRIRLEVMASAPCLLMNSTSYSPYWKAVVNGVPAEIIPADHTFQAVMLKAGESIVEFEYKPSYAFWKNL
jgi:Protein of unknown function (DUF6044)